MHEIWKDIIGFEGFYQISNTGKVRSFNKSTKYHNLEHFLKPTILNSGYASVTLYGANKKRRKCLIHQLVAEHFIPNPDNCPCVNHKDENKLNNISDNLEWCTYSYNNAYGTAKIRSIETKTEHKVEQYTIDGHWIATYLSCGIASKITNLPVEGIRQCCTWKKQSAYGYIWKYDTLNEKVSAL